MANGDVPAGWYPDPSGGSGQRWWDGNAWSEHVHPPVEQAPVEQAPVEQAPVEQAPSIPAGWYPDPEGGSGQRWWDGGSWSAHVAPAASPQPTSGQEVTEPEPTVGQEATAPTEVPVAHEEQPVDVPESEQPSDEQALPASESPVTGGAPEAVAAGAAAAAAAVPAGWYPDPSGTGNELWWTGESWSEHVRAPQIAPGGAGEPAPTQAQAAIDPAGEQATEHRPHSGPPPEEGDGDGSSGSGKSIMIIVGILLLLGAVFAGLWFGSDLFDREEEMEEVAQEAPVEAVEEELAEEEPEPEVIFTDIRDVDLAELEWQTTCIGTEASPDQRAGQPQAVTMASGSTGRLEHDSPFDASGLPVFEVETAFVEFGDVTGDGQDEIIVPTNCLGMDFFDAGLDVWYLEDGRPVQLPTPPIELPLDSVFLDRFEGAAGVLTVYTSELQDDGGELEVVTEYAFGAGSWNVQEIDREVPVAAVDGESIQGVNFPPLADGSWVFEPRLTPQEPLIADNVDVPLTLVIAMDESLNGLIGGLGYDELLEEWLTIFESLAEDEGVELAEGWVTDIELEGADQGTLLVYEDHAAEINYYIMVLEVDGLVVEVSQQLDAEGLVDDPEFLEAAVEFYEGFSFDPDELLAGFEN